MCIEPRPKWGWVGIGCALDRRDEKSVAIRENRGVYNGRDTETGIEAGRGYVIPSMRRENYAQGYQSVMCRVIDEE